MDDICNQTENKRDVLSRVGPIGKSDWNASTDATDWHAVDATQQPLRNKYNVERVSLSYSPCYLLVGPVERGIQRDQGVIEDDRNFEVGESRGTRIRARLD